MNPARGTRGQAICRASRLRTVGAQARRERGSSTVLMAGVIAGVLSLAAGGLTLASAVVASHQARSAADLAALAGAAVAMRGDAPTTACAAAARVAGVNNGRVLACSPAGEELFVRVAVSPSMPALGEAVASARAGPAPSQPP